MINDIIKLSELDSSEAQQGFEQLDLYGLVKDCMENLQVNAEQRKVALNFDGTDCMVRGNRQLLTELVENLCQNAIRYNNEPLEGDRRHRPRACDSKAYSGAA